MSMADGERALRVRQWALALLVLLAFARGVWALGEKSLWWDESLSLHRSSRTLSYALSNQIILTDNVDQVVTIDEHPPLYFVLLWGVTRLLGHSEFALRFLSLAAIVLLVPLLYVTGKRLVDAWAGLAAAALTALSPMYLWYGQEVRNYALVALLSLLSFYLFFRAFFDPEAPPALRGRWTWVVAWILVSMGLVATHYLGALLVVLQLVALGLDFGRQSGNRRLLLLIIALVLVATLVPLTYVLLTRSGVGERPGFEFVSLPVLLRDLLNSFGLGPSADVGLWYVLLIDLLFLLFLIWGLVWLVRPGASARNRTAGLLLSGYLFLPILVLFLFSFVLPVYMNSRHLILISPAFYLLVAVGLTRWQGRMAWVAALCALLMVGGVIYSTYNYFYNPGYDKDHHREWGEYLRAHVRPGDVVVVNPPHIAELYDYYASSEVPWIGLPLLGGSRQDTKDRLEGLLEQYDRVWLALSRTPPWGDRGRVPQNWLNENAFRLSRESFQSYASAILATSYLREWPSVSSLPDDAQPLGVRYTPELRLEGYRLASESRSGDLLQVQLYWATDDYLAEQYSVLLRLVDEIGHIWGQDEGCPYDGLYPMWQWQPNLTLRDEHGISISPGTPPGQYQLELILVSRPSEDGCAGPAGPTVAPLSALPQAFRGDRVLLGTVDVQAAGAPPSRDDLGIERPRQARFDGLGLMGVNLTPEALRAGGRLDVTLFWEARRSPFSELFRSPLPVEGQAPVEMRGAGLPDAQFRLRLVDPTGEIWQEALIRPAGNSHPTDRWWAGERFKGQFGLLLPEDAPGGRYTVELSPEPPLQQTGIGATLCRLLGGEAPRVKLGSVDVEALATGQLSEPIPLPDDLVLSSPLLATLGDRVRFLGYDLHTESAQPGGEVSFTLYWQALRPMEFSYSVFTHLLGPSNQVVGQKDGVPQDGAYATTQWQPGEVIVDRYSFVVNPDVPPGSYPLEIGMYRAETGVRLPVLDADGQVMPGKRILLPEVTILPAPTPTPVVRQGDHHIYLPLVMSEKR
jgi:4-amino-4-deoxy-L-arabinose transferase-like glycosyltransferase